MATEAGTTKKSKILLLSPYFYPEIISTGRYNTILAEALVAIGAEITIITSHPFYPAWKPVYSDAAPDNVSIIRGGGWVRYPSIPLLRRAVVELWFAFHVWWTILRKRCNPDLIVSVFPPVFFFCCKRLLPRSCRKVGIIHDYQGILGFRKKGVLSRAIQWLVKKVESKAFDSCDLVVVLSQSMAQLGRTEYGIGDDKLRVVYPFVSLRGKKSNGENLADVFPSEYDHIVYSGALGQKQNSFGLYHFFCAAALRVPHARFHIFSEGPVFERLCGIYESDPVPGVKLHTLVSDTDLEELYARSTVQVIPQGKGVAEACLPSKLPNILASGCAPFVICEREGELGEIVQRYNGMWVSEWDQEVLVTCLIKFLQALKREGREVRKAAALQLARQEFSIEKLLNAVLGSQAVVDPSSIAS